MSKKGRSRRRRQAQKDHHRYLQQNQKKSRSKRKVFQFVHIVTEDEVEAIALEVFGDVRRTFKDANG